MESITGPKNVETASKDPFGIGSLGLDLFPAQTSANATAPAPFAKEGFHGSALPRPTVLSVDDNDDLLYVMGLTLSMMGFEVISCSDAHSASAAFHARDGIDLLITDLEMPGRSGVELALELCSLRSSLPVLIVSGNYLSANLLQEIRAKQWRFLTKPYATSELSTHIHDLLHTGAPRRQVA